MHTYSVTTSNLPVDWTAVEKQRLSSCSWSPFPAPDVSVQAVRSDASLIVRLECLAPVSRAVNLDPDSSVWQDNCLEFFFDAGDNRYINLEANANGALHAAIGSSRNGRVFLRSLPVQQPSVVSRFTESGWEAVFTVPFSLIPDKEHLRANFYACGDLTPEPYYSAWNPVLTDQPDFHQPDFFGSLTF